MRGHRGRGGGGGGVPEEPEAVKRAGGKSPPPNPPSARTGPQALRPALQRGAALSLAANMTVAVAGCRWPAAATTQAEAEGCCGVRPVPPAGRVRALRPRACTWHPGVWGGGREGDGGGGGLLRGPASTGTRQSQSTAATSMHMAPRWGGERGRRRGVVAGDAERLAVL